MSQLFINHCIKNLGNNNLGSHFLYPYNLKSTYPLVTRESSLMYPFLQRSKGNKKPELAPLMNNFSSLTEDFEAMGRPSDR
jgi:oxalate decarboxylase/phosphoglucose isomerase-like protein (cupin superfamily)